jgi:hypothetical protein
MKKVSKSQLAQYIIEQAKKLYKAEVLKEEKKVLEKRVALMEGRSYEVGFEYTDYSTGTVEGEKTYDVICKVTPGSPGSFYGGPDGVGSPPEPDDIDIISVIDKETGLAVDIDSLSQEVIDGIIETAESQEGGVDEPDWDMMRDDLDENSVKDVDAKTFKEFKEKYNIVGTGPGGKILYADMDRALPNFTDQEKYNFALMFANRHISRMLPGFDWDTLADTNSLWDYIDGVYDALSLDKAAREAVKDRISEEGGEGLFEVKK